MTLILVGDIRTLNDDDMNPDFLPAHERPLGRLVGDSGQDIYQPLQSLEEAKLQPDGVVILQGDDGGQIYVVVIADDVACSQARLEQLLLEIDGRCWKDPSMARVYYERRPVGSGVPGGKGGGLVTTSTWIHKELVDMGLA